MSVNLEKYRWNVTLMHRMTRAKTYRTVDAPSRGLAQRKMRQLMITDPHPFEGYVFRVDTLPENLVFTAAQVKEGMGWLMECEWADVEPEEIEGYQPWVIVRGVQRHYENGWFGFLADLALETQV